VVAIMNGLTPAEPEQFDRFWYHAFHTALSAKAICRSLARSVDPEQLHVAALLHDVGKLVYLKFFPEPYQELSRHCLSQADMMVDAEEQLGLTSHVELGTTLADRWSMPSAVKQACAFHELRDLKRLNDERADNADELKVLCAANLLSNLSTRKLAAELKTEIRAEVLRALDCNEGGFLLLMGELYELKSVVQRFLIGL
jgi:putative nucleotidyltransferase with HDIG domain